jgi:spermidine synthase
VERLLCVEIEPATFEAAPFFASLSGAVRQDPRFSVLFGDGRTHLLRTRERYDVIVSEPSNPWITGVANLFTREFYETAKARLPPGGVFGQWFHYYRFEPQDVKVEIATFAAVFPHASLWLVPPVRGPEGPHLAADFLLVGSLEPHALEWARLHQAFSGSVGNDLRASGLAQDPAGLAAAWAMDGEGMKHYARDPAFPRGTPQNTDDHPFIELVAPRRKLMPRERVARLAQGQYEALAAAGDPKTLPLRGLPEAEAPAFWAELGRLYEERAQPFHALQALERATTLDPDRVEAWERLSVLRLERREYEEAEAAHRAFLGLRPSEVAAWLRLAAVCARQGKWLEAREAIDRARRLDPKAPVDPGLLEFLEKQVGPGQEKEGAGTGRE